MWIEAGLHPGLVSQHHEQLGPPPGIEAQDQGLAGDHSQLLGPTICFSTGCFRLGQPQVLVTGKEWEEELAESVFRSVRLQVAIVELVGVEEQVQILWLQVKQFQGVGLSKDQEGAATGHLGI